jgi:hypothetical protein
MSRRQRLTLLATLILLGGSFGDVWGERRVSRPRSACW